MEQKLSPATRLLIKYRRPLVVVSQQLLVLFSNYAAFWLRFDGSVPPVYVELHAQTIWTLILIRLIVFTPLGLHEGLWRYAGIWDLRNIIVGVAGSSFIFYVVVHQIFGLTWYPRSIYFVDAILLLVLMGGLRLTRRIHRELGLVNRERKVLVVGAGDAGEMIVRQMKQDTAYDSDPLGFIDDDERKVGLSIHGVPVLGTTRDLSRIVTERKPTEILIAMPGADSASIRALIRILEPFTIPIKTLPNLRDVLSSRVHVSQIRDLNIEDLLARPPVGLDPAPLRRLIEGKCVFVSGAGGSIGSELSCQIAALNPSNLILLDRYENGLFAVVNRFADAAYGCPMQAVIGDVTDAARMADIFRAFSPDIVFHAAAHKHVPLMEANPCEAVKNNVSGTRILGETAIRHGVERFILISTDKAVNPTNVMGTTKRVAELVVQDLNGQSDTAFAIVRFGNVLGSNGSVVPRFLAQIKAGGPVTVTHPNIERYFMLIPEAVQLVLHAAAQAGSGSLYVLDMGEQIKLLDMARDLIRLSGFVPEQQIAIAFVGLRPGEKLSEELVGSGEVVEPSEVDKIRRVRAPKPSAADAQLLQLHLRRLEEIAHTGSVGDCIRQLRRVVPTFVPSEELAALADHEPATAGR